MAIKVARGSRGPIARRTMAICAHFLLRAAAAVIYASKENDPGTIDLFGNFRERMLKEGSMMMDTVKYVENEGQIPTYFPDRPAPSPLSVYTAEWSLESQNRTMCLIVEDMEKDYESLLEYIMPNAVNLLAKWRETGQPILWFNWNRLPDDGAYGAIDRFYGPKGVYPPGGTELFEGHIENPMYIDELYTPNGTDTISVLAPITEEEKSLVIKSLHLSKFSDRDANGADILYPILRAWGVDTIVIIGAWTEDCILATAVEGSDGYGMDVVIIEDALGTATPAHAAAIDVMSESVAKVLKTSEMLEYLDTHPDKLKPPLVGLSYEAVSVAMSSNSGSKSTAASTTLPLYLVFLLCLAVGILSGLIGRWSASRHYKAQPNNDGFCQF